MLLKKLRVCVIDDEGSIRKELIKEINESLQMEVVGEGESVSEAAKIVIETNPDAIFLDIKLREGDAFQVMDILRREMTSVPPVIINTGYNDFEYAQRVFNQYRDCVITILQKPFWEDWDKKESQIVDQIYAFYSAKENKNESNRVVVKSDYKTYVFQPHEIMYIEVNENKDAKGKTVIETIDHKIYLNKSLTELQKILPQSFLRISRFLIINMHYFDYFDHSDHVVFLKGLKRNFGVGQAYEENIFKVLN